MTTAREENLARLLRVQKTRPLESAALAASLLNEFLDEDLANSEDAADICLSVISLQERVEEELDRLEKLPAEDRSRSEIDTLRFELAHANAILRDHGIDPMAGLP